MPEQPSTKINKKNQLGIVLSGGGARGIAHLGVLKALEEQHIKPDVICGVSSGAIVGAFYADGWEPDAIFNLFKDQGFFKFVKIGFPKTGLLRLSGFIKMFKDHLSTDRFEDLQKRLVVMATNFNLGEPAFFSEGDIIKPILASSSIPVLFSPVELDGHLYVDGGLYDNLPYEPINEYCHQLIGVHVNPIGRSKDFNNLVDIAERTFQLSVAGHIPQKKGQFDLFIEPPGLDEYNILRISKADEIFNIGYESAQKLLMHSDTKPSLETD